MLTLPLFMGMHEGMGGPHVMAVDVATNDPVEPVKTLRWRFVAGAGDDQADGNAGG